MRRLFIVCLLLVSNLVTSAQPSPKLLPFQGRVIDTHGIPIPDGPRVIRFRISESPVENLFKWVGELHRATVNDGLINVVLGSRTPMEGVDFGRQLFLEITIDSNTDGAITEDDPPMLPRQAILPVLFAQEAGNSQKLGGFDWSSPPPGVTVPIGGVLMWWGEVSRIPPGFELCDGELARTPDAVLKSRKPDLRDRFVKGSGVGVQDVAANPISGGAHFIGPQSSEGTALTQAQIPPHVHFVNLLTGTDGAHSHRLAIQQNGSQGTYGLIAGDVSGFSGPHARSTESAGAHQHSVSGNTAMTGDGQPHQHVVPGHDNRPAFLEMIFIIRVL